jgi:seryl-tRNA(Sec) selenium transferase
MTITLLIITAASIALNVFQLMERKGEKKELNRLVADGALLEQEHKKLTAVYENEKLTAVYENEKLHKEWAIGRIKDQQAVIEQLKMNIVPRTKKPYPRKEARND